MSNIPPSSSSGAYDGNSLTGKSKAADKKDLKPVILGNVTERKKTLGRRFVELFGVDNSQSVGQFIMQDVLIPTIKDLISNVVGQGVDRFLFGSSRSGGRILSSDRNHKPYNTMYNGGGGRAITTAREEDRLNASERANHDFRNLIFEKRGDAEVVLDNLIMAITDYDIVSVADLYQLIHMTPNFVDHKFGWNDLSEAHVRQVRGGYLLVLPKVMDID